MSNSAPLSNFFCTKRLHYRHMTVVHCSVDTIHLQCHVQKWQNLDHTFLVCRTKAAPTIIWFLSGKAEHLLMWIIKPPDLKENMEYSLLEEYVIISIRRIHHWNVLQNTLSDMLQYTTGIMQNQKPHLSTRLKLYVAKPLYHDSMTKYFFSKLSLNFYMKFENSNF